MFIVPRHQLRLSLSVVESPFVTPTRLVFEQGIIYRFAKNKGVALDRVNLFAPYDLHPWIPNWTVVSLPRGAFFFFSVVNLDIEDEIVVRLSGS
jgi:hypothetical protein